MQIQRLQGCILGCCCSPHPNYHLSVLSALVRPSGTWHNLWKLCKFVLLDFSQVVWELLTESSVFANSRWCDLAYAEWPCLSEEDIKKKIDSLIRLEAGAFFLEFYWDLWAVVPIEFLWEWFFHSIEWCGIVFQSQVQYRPRGNNSLQGQVTVRLRIVCMKQPKTEDGWIHEGAFFIGLDYAGRLVWSLLKN